MTKERHNETMTRLAEQHLKTMMSGSGTTLRDVSADGISIEADAAMTDIAMTNTLHALASHWGYAHGECPVTIEDLPFDFYAPAKRATIKFV